MYSTVDAHSVVAAASMLSSSSLYFRLWCQRWRVRELFWRQESGSHSGGTAPAPQLLPCPHDHLPHQWKSWLFLIYRLGQAYGALCQLPLKTDISVKEMYNKVSFSCDIQAGFKMFKALKVAAVVSRVSNIFQ